MVTSLTHFTPHSQSSPHYPVSTQHHRGGRQPPLSMGSRESQKEIYLTMSMSNMKNKCIKCIKFYRGSKWLTMIETSWGKSSFWSSLMLIFIGAEPLGIRVFFISKEKNTSMGNYYFKKQLIYLSETLFVVIWASALSYKRMTVWLWYRLEMCFPSYYYISQMS